MRKRQAHAVKLKTSEVGVSRLIVDFFRDKVTKGMMTKVGTGCLLYAVVINLGVTASPLFDNSHGVCFLVNEDLGEAIREVAVAGVLSHFFVVPSVVILACALAAVIKLALRQNSSRL